MTSQRNLFKAKLIKMQHNSYARCNMNLKWSY